jgi:type I restriction enzyme S subunit
MVIIRPNKLEIQPIYCFYLFRSLQNNFSVFSSGSAQPQLPIKDLKAMSFLLPSLPEQKAIAAVLSSLDDKIDLLDWQNKTLEAIAETLFRQWFIEDRNTKHCKLGDFIETTSGGTPSRTRLEYYINGTIPWIKSKELCGSYILKTEERITDVGMKNSSAKILPKNAVLIAMYGATVGEYAIIASEAACNQAICALLPNNKYPYTMLYLIAKVFKYEIINLAVGSAQQNISQDIIKQLEIPAPCENILVFHRLVNPLFEKIKSNTKQIHSLTQLRDNLLPKLMSGEVRTL